MSYITRSRLAELVSNRSGIERLHESTRRAFGTTFKRVFLSHSHRDGQLIDFAVLLFKKENAGVYIDHEDPSMPTITNVTTADKLKSKINECERFVVLASDQSLTSRWVPWELGYADGIKHRRNIAILPVQDKEGSWKGTEYVGLYSTLQVNDSGKWVVVEPGSGLVFAELLSKWLT